VKVARGWLVAEAITGLVFALFSIGSASAAPPTIVAAVVTDAANVRSGPSTQFGIVGSVHEGAEVDVVAQVAGEEVHAGNAIWYQLPSGGFIYSAVASPLFGDGPRSGEAAPPSQQVSTVMSPEVRPSL